MPCLSVIGAINWDTTLFVDELPKPGHEIRTRKMTSGPGGKGANTAVAAARILGNQEAAVIGMLGTDELGDAQISVLRSEGVDVSCVGVCPEVKSGQAFVIVDKFGENMIITHRAANSGVTREFTESHDVIKALASSKAVVIIDPPLDAAAELVSRARSDGKKIIFSPATLVQSGFASLEQIMLAADYVIVNEHEARLLTGVSDALESSEKLSARLDGKTTITTLGKRGCAICSGGKNEIIRGIDPSIFGLKVVSTVGAGDTFVGAFTSFKVLGMSDIMSIFLANIAAALKVSSEETRGSPSYEKIIRYAESDALIEIYNSLKARQAHP